MTFKTDIITLIERLIILIFYGYDIDPYNDF